MRSAWIWKLALPPAKYASVRAAMGTNLLAGQNQHHDHVAAGWTRQQLQRRRSARASKQTVLKQNRNLQSRHVLRLSPRRRANNRHKTLFSAPEKRSRRRKPSTNSATNSLEPGLACGCVLIKKTFVLTSQRSLQSSIHRSVAVSAVRGCFIWGGGGGGTQQ